MKMTERKLKISDFHKKTTDFVYKKGDIVKITHKWPFLILFRSKLGIFHENLQF